MRDRHCNIRDTWDIACGAAVAGGLYALLLAGIVAGRSGPMEAEEVVTGTGVLMLLPLPYLLGWCALPGWRVMQWIGRRARTNLVAASAMAGMAAGLVADLLVLGVLLAVYGAADVFSSVAGAWLGMTVLSTVPVAYMMAAALLGALRWKRLEERRLV